MIGQGNQGSCFCLFVKLDPAHYNNIAGARQERRAHPLRTTEIKADQRSCAGLWQDTPLPRDAFSILPMFVWLSSGISLVVGQL